MAIPDIISFAVRLFVAYEAGTSFVERLLAVRTTKTPDVPLEVWRHSQDVLVEDLIPASGTDRRLMTTSHQARTLAAASCSVTPPCSPIVLACTFMHFSFSYV